MFTNLIESSSHQKEFKRRGSFVLITIFAYSLILSAAGIASVYAYDAQLEAQTSRLELLNWVPPVTPEGPQPVRDTPPATVRRPRLATAPIDPNIQVAERQARIPPTDDPRVIPHDVGVVGSSIPSATGPVRFTDRNVNPPTGPGGDRSGNCVVCGDGTAPVVKIDEKLPEPPPVKPPTTKRVPSEILIAKVISLPPPRYPDLARRTGIQGPVSVQILVDERGNVISAQSVSGNAFLTAAAKEAAMRARFTPTVLNGTPIKIQGVITYNFRLQ